MNPFGSYSMPVSSRASVALLPMAWVWLVDVLPRARGCASTMLPPLCDTRPPKVLAPLSRSVPLPDLTKPLVAPLITAGISSS